MKQPDSLSDMSREDSSPLAHLDNEDLMALPSPLESPEKDHNWTPLSGQARER